VEFSEFKFSLARRPAAPEPSPSAQAGLTPAPPMAAAAPPPPPARASAHEYDVFLSHKFVGGKHAPLTLSIFAALEAAGLRVWLDKVDMGRDLNASMKHGIEKSGCVVALMTRRYGTDADALARRAAWDAAREGRCPDEWDPKEDNCVKELTWAKECGKAVIACLVDDDVKWFPSPESFIVETNLIEPKTHLMLNFTAEPAAAQENLLKFVREATSPGLQKGCYGIVPSMRHGGLYGIKGYCFDVKEDHDLHKSNDPIIIWSRKDLARKDSRNQLFYAERADGGDADCFLLRAKCCSDDKRRAFVGVAADGTLVVADAPYRWRIARASGAFTMAPADDASRRVELSFLVTVFGAQPRVAASRGAPELKHMFHFMKV